MKLRRRTGGRRRSKKNGGIVGAVRVTFNSGDKHVGGGRKKRMMNKRIIPVSDTIGGCVGEVSDVIGQSILPNRPLTSYDINLFIKRNKIPHFRGVFMRDDLPRRKPRRNECMIINQDSTGNYGTHWTCFVKTDNDVFYFDSFGRLPPALEVIEYLNGCRIYYNQLQYQQFDTIICGHLCLCFLYEYYKNSGKS